jgi:hypothetical protein
MSEYDITTGYLFRQFPDDFVKFIAGDTAKKIKLADPVLKQTRYADATAYATLKSLDGAEAEVIVHIEFQTDADDTMPVRMAGYIGRLIDMYRRPIHASVIYLRPQEINDPGMYEYTFPNRFVAEYNVIKIWEFDGEEFLAKRILGLLPFTPLMQPEGVSDEEWLGKCVRTIEEAVPNEQDRKDLLASTSVLAGLVHDVNFVQTFIPEEIMRQSSVVKALLDKERKEIAREKGTQYIISVLEVRFGEVDDAIKNSLASIQDEEILNYLHRQAVIAEKEEVERKIYALSA